MSSSYSSDYTTPFAKIFYVQKKKRYWLHIGLFILTFVTTTFAGAEWTTGTFGPYTLELLLRGLPYSLSILFVITCHEFGHYFAAKYHEVDATLPYYIPFPPILGFINFGTMGAVIKTTSPIKTRRAMFDIGIAGPIAGFVASIAILIYGFINVPGEEYILSIHPDYFSPEYGSSGLQLVFGDTILFSFFKFLFVDNSKFFPPMSEIYHYPFLCVGWFGLLITAMNMLPVGQLDGGHISYTMFGEKKHYMIAVITFVFLFIFGLSGFADSMLGLNLNIGWSGWLFWALILYFVIRLKHPPIFDDAPLDSKRMILGYFSFVILLLSFSPNPIIIASVG